MSSEHDLVAAYGQWVVEYMAKGWEGTLLTFMFNPLPGRGTRRSEAMDREITWVYSRCLSRMFRHPSARINSGRLPLWLISPDWPVPKADKDHYRDIVVNDGEHRHAVALSPPSNRLKTSFANFIDNQQRFFTGRDRTLWRIDAQPITDAAEYATAYVLKSVERGRISPGDVYTLPRGADEMRDDIERFQPWRIGR